MAEKPKKKTRRTYATPELALRVVSGLVADDLADFADLLLTQKPLQASLLAQQLNKARGPQEAPRVQPAPSQGVTSPQDPRHAEQLLRGAR